MDVSEIYEGWLVIQPSHIIVDSWFAVLESFSFVDNFGPKPYSDAMAVLFLITTIFFMVYWGWDCDGCVPSNVLVNISESLFRLKVPIRYTRHSIGMSQIGCSWVTGAGLQHLIPFLVELSENICCSCQINLIEVAIMMHCNQKDPSPFYKCWAQCMGLGNAWVLGSKMEYGMSNSCHLPGSSNQLHLIFPTHTCRFIVDC